MFNRLLPAVLVFAASLLSATAWQAQQPASTTSPTQLPSASDIRGDVEVLSDTMGVDFKPYLERVTYAIKTNWYRLVPEVAKAPIKKSGMVAVRFSILRNGSVAGMVLEESSKDRDLDKAAWQGMTSSDPFPQLPSKFNGNALELRVKFLYNPNSEARSMAADPQTIPSVPEPRQAPSPFNVPIGIDYAKQSSKNITSQDAESTEAPGIEILSPKDARDFDLKEFLEQRFIRIVARHWYQLVPEKAKIRHGKSGKVAVMITVNKDGTFRSVDLDQSSDDGELDLAAMQAVKASEPIPLPESFSGSYLKLRLKFYYNPKKTSK